MAIADITFPVFLTLEEAYEGTDREFVFPRDDAVCDACDGGAPAPDQACSVCGGTGRTTMPRRLRVAVPAGVNDQVRLKVAGQGRWDPVACQWGDLYLVCYLRPHKRFVRKGFDLTTTVVVPTPQPDQITLRTLAGEVGVPLPSNPAVPGIKLQGYGMPKRIGGGSAGDLTVELISQADMATEAEHRQAAADAAAALASGRPGDVVQLLADARIAARLDANDHATLGSALWQLGDRDAADRHLRAALLAEPGNPLHTLNLGLHALRCRRFLPSAVCLEVFRRRAPVNATARAALQQAVAGLFGDAAAAASDPQSVAALSAAAAKAQHRSYSDGYRAIAAAGAARVEVRAVAAGLLLLAAAGGDESALPAAAALVREPAMASGACALAVAATGAYEDYCDAWCGLRGHLALAHFHIGRSEAEAAIDHARRAVEQARRGAMPTRETAGRDPVAKADEQALSQLFGATTAACSRLGVHRLLGLLAAARAHYFVRFTGDVGAGWPDALQAVQSLDVALCQTPDDPEVTDDLQNAVDHLSGIGAALIGKTDVDREEFYASTRDAAATGLVPQAPVNDLAIPGSSRSALRRLCDEAFTWLQGASHLALRGEFLVGAVSGYHVLTNYRMLLVDARSGRTHNLPLCDIDRYTARPSGLSAQCVVIGIGSGRQLTLDGVPRGAFPVDHVVSYLIAARMWERLTAHEVSTLSAGTGAGPSSDPRTAPAVGGQAPGPLLQLPGAAGGPACPGCGRGTRSGDRFCRKCGAAVPPDAGPRAMITGGA